MSSASTGGRGRRMAFAAFGLLIALGAGLLWWATSNQVGEPPSPVNAQHSGASPKPGTDAAGPTSIPGGATTFGAAGTAGETAAPEDTEEATSETTPADTAAPAMATVEAFPASEPVRVSIPAIDVESQVHALGLNDDGTLQVPSGELYEQAAWYDGSPTPGETGPSVIEGHVTSQGSVPSVFFELGALESGDLVEVERADGTTATFEVYDAESFPKDTFPKSTVYGNTQGPELRLITCGGTYDPDAHAHVDNIVVFARLVP